MICVKKLRIYPGCALKQENTIVWNENKGSYSHMPLVFAVDLSLYRAFSREYVCNERGVYGLTRIFTPLSTYDLVIFYAHLVDA